MFSHYVTSALRFLQKNRAYTFINIVGLATGLACSLAILFFIQDELSYDRAHQHAGRTFRLTVEAEGFGLHANTPPPLAPAIRSTYPEVEYSTRVFRHWRSPLVAHGKTGFIENEFFYVDPEFFQVFSFPLVHGDSSTALSSPLSVVITEEMATKYFGADNPVGQTLVLNTDLRFTVTGVVRTPPQNMHFHPAFLASITSLREVMWPAVLETWSLGAMKTYVTLRNNASPADFSVKVSEFYPKHHDPASHTRLHLQPLTDIHLHSDLPNEIEPNSDIRYVYLLAAIAGILLAIAGMNYMNLATARSATRGREVGMRKVVGAHRGNLIAQFLGESLMLASISVILAVAMTELLLPFLNAMTGRTITHPHWTDPGVLLGLFGTAVTLGLLAGSYPAFILSSFQPIRVLKGTTAAGSGGQSTLRKILVTAQFCVSVALIFSTIVIMQQVRYLRSAKPGFNKEHIAVIPLRDETLSGQTMHSELIRVPGVTAVAASNSYPGHGYASDDVRWQGSDQSAVMSINWVNDAFLDAMGISLVAGRNFSAGLETDWSEAALINERAMKTIGVKSPEDAIGMRIYPGGTDTPAGRRIIGVMKDFHFESFHHAIEPLVYIPQKSHLSYLLVRLSPGYPAEKLSVLREKWGSLSTAQPFTFSFLDQEFNLLYQSEERWSQTMAAGATVAIVIACLGLLGLASFMTRRRTREIGIRKILGASTAGVVRLLSFDFVKLVILSEMIALPLAWYGMDRWLEDFAYRIDISWWMVVCAAGLGLVVAIGTVSVHAVTAAVSRAVDTLRYE